MAEKYVYHFREGNKDMKALLGGKGANLAEMTGIGLPVPPGFTVTTEVCNHYSARGAYPDGLEAQVDAALAQLEADTGKKLRRRRDPLLLSVRSGARASMPGMMDTILNLGLNDTTVQGVVALTGNPRFAYDCYRRFVSMYGDVVLGCKPEDKDAIDPFEEILDEMKKGQGRHLRHRPHGRRPQGAGRPLQGGGQGAHGTRLPRRPARAALGRHHRPSSAPGGTTARSPTVALYDIPDDVGHRGQRPGHGLRQHGRRVGHRRRLHARPGDRRERVLRRVPRQRPGRGRGRRRAHAAPGRRTRRRVRARVYAELLEVRKTLERELRDMQDFEFTIEKGRLYMLQTRNGKRTGLAAIRIAVDMCEEGLITPDDALMRIEPEQLNQLLRPVFSREAKTGGRRGGPGPGQGPARRPRRRHRPSRLQRPRRRSLGGEGREGPSRAHRDEPRGHPRHGRRGGHPHGARRHDHPRRPGRPPDGQGLRRRAARPSRSTTARAL